MARIEHFDKRVGITYVYESTSYYDKEKHQSRSRRKLIGKLDPETGELVPTGARGRPKKHTTPDDKMPDYEMLYKQVQKGMVKKEEEIAQLTTALQRAKDECLQLRRIIDEIINLCRKA